MDVNVIFDENANEDIKHHDQNASKDTFINAIKRGSLNDRERE